MADTSIKNYCGTRESGNYTVTSGIYLHDDPDDASFVPYLNISYIQISASTSAALNQSYIYASISGGDGTMVSTTTFGTIGSSGGKYYRFASFTSQQLKRLYSGIGPGDAIPVYITVRIGASSASASSIYLNGPLYYPRTDFQITPPQSVQTTALNVFTCSSFKREGTLTCQLKLASGKYSNAYYNSTTQLSAVATDISVTSFTIYHSHKNTLTTDFTGGVGTYTLELKEYKDSTYFGRQELINCTITGQIAYNDVAPQAAYPALTLTSTEVGGVGILAQYGKYIKGKSRVQFTTTKSFKYGATQSLYSLSAAGTTTYVNSALTVSPTADGSAVATLKDNFDATVTRTIAYEVYDYWDPDITVTAIHRCKQDGTRDDFGGYCEIEWGINVAPLGNQNSKELTITCPDGTSEQQVMPTLTGYTCTGSFIVQASTELAFNIVYSLTDDFATITRTVRLSTAGVILDILTGGTGLAFGKVASLQNAVEFANEWAVAIEDSDGKRYDLLANLKELARRTGLTLIEVTTQQNQ